MRSPRAAGLWAVLAMAGCTQLWGIDELSYEGPSTGGAGGTGGGGASAGGSGGMAGAGGAGGTGGEGAGTPTVCTSDKECVDGDPCTVGDCDTSGVCGQMPVPAGEPGTGEGPCVGTCQTDGACGLSLYSRNFDGGDSSDSFTKQPLSVVWTGANAPPPRGIRAAAHAHLTDLLVVFSDVDGGAIHIRAEGTWIQAPTGTILDGLDGLTVNSATFFQNYPSDPQTITVTAPGQGGQKLAFVYAVNAEGMVTPNTDNPFVIQDPPDNQAADQHLLDADWELSVQTAYQGNAGWVVFWRSYQADVWEIDGGDFSWDPHGADVASPLWEGSPAPSSPAAGTTVAAYHDDNVLYLVAP